MVKQHEAPKIDLATLPALMGKNRVGSGGTIIPGVTRDVLERAGADVVLQLVNSTIVYRKAMEAVPKETLLQVQPSHPDYQPVVRFSNQILDNQRLTPAERSAIVLMASEVAAGLGRQR